MTSELMPSPTALAHPSPRLSGLGQLVICGGALLLAGFGVQNHIAEWSPDLALYTFVWLLLGPVAWFLVLNGPARRIAADLSFVPRWSFVDVTAMAMMAAISWGLSCVTSQQIGPLPPAYHDEYSYRFQAETLLAGRFSWPSHPTHPELFDQVHVLNEGRMASRYYPGAGAWMAPWVALGHPYVGHWLAGAICAAMVYLIGRELRDRWTGVIAGVLFAAAPGPALFGNLLLAHHPTMLGLLVFTWAFVRAMRTRHVALWFLAGCGLCGAMLCRPATAAGFALPFGVWIGSRTIWQWASHRGASTWAAVTGLGLPLLVGGLIMTAYNASVAGRGLTSPYQLYTDLYTPRHVFGLNNVVRGERHLGPKVLDSYDRWAENLTPTLAWKNTFDRWLSTGLWTVDLPILTLTTLALPWLWPIVDARWRLLFLSLLSLFAIHWPYWYAGIFGWHYVFEGTPVWCLCAALLVRTAGQSWWQDRRDLLFVWTAGLIALAWAGMYVVAEDGESPRWQKGVNVIRYPRQRQGAFQDWIAAHVQIPALVLVDAPHDGQQIDFVVNHAGLAAPLLIGRYRSRETDLGAVSRDFPHRQLYIVNPDRGTLQMAP